MTSASARGNVAARPSERIFACCILERHQPQREIVMKNAPTKELRELNESEMKQVYGGALTTQNPGGKQHGKSQATTTPSGNAPPGLNKNLPPGQKKKF